MSVVASVVLLEASFIQQRSAKPWWDWKAVLHCNYLSMSYLE